VPALAVGNVYTAPFDAAVPALLACSLGARMLWCEHKGGVFTGDAASRNFALGSIRQAANEICSDSGLRSMMVMIALYESALYIFVFLWTPVLEDRAGMPEEGQLHIPHGLIFSLFMCCKMAGSQLFVLVLRYGVNAAHILCAVFIASVLCFMVPLLTSSYVATLLAFSVYELGLGLYWPAIAILRAELVPDDIRSTVASLFRVPLNVLVVACLLLIGHAPQPVVLLLCSAQLAVCAWSAATLQLQQYSKESISMPSPTKLNNPGIKKNLFPEQILQSTI